jgi:AcrR family transcriptional regulator
VIARRGLGSTTFRHVAEEAGVGLGVITYHFPSRRKLLTAAFELHLEQTDAQGRAFSDAHAQAWRSQSLSLDEMTDAAVELLARLVSDDRDSFVASQELTLELTRDPDLARDVQDALSSHRRVIEQMVESAGSSEPELEAEILSAAFEGLALKWLAHPEDPEFVARLRRVVRHLMQKLLPEGGGE